MKKLLSLLTIAPFALTACTTTSKDTGTEPGTGGDGNTTELEKDVADLISTKVDFTHASGDNIDSRSHKEDIMDIVNYVEYYDENYELEDLIALPDGVDLSDVKASHIEDVIITSHGGPVFKAIPNYFDGGHGTAYVGTTDASLFGKEANDKKGNPPTSTSWDRTVYVDSNKTWADNGFPVTSGYAATDMPVDGTFYYAAFTNDHSGDSVPTTYKPTQQMVAAVQAHQLHHDEFMDLTENAQMAFEKTVEFNLRTVAILDVVASKMLDEVTGVDLHFLSHSLGAVMSTLYLSTMGYVNDQLPDREFMFETFVTGAGRIQFEDEVADSFTQGIGGQFIDEDPSNSGATDGVLEFVSFTEAEMVAGLGIEYENDKVDYDNLATQAEKDAHDASLQSYIGGMTKEHYINRLRSGMQMQGHFGMLNNGDIMKVYGGDYVKNKAYFAHGGMDQATGPLRQDERDIITADWAGELFVAGAPHGIPHLFDRTFQDNNLWELFGASTAHIKLA